MSCFRQLHRATLASGLLLVCLVGFACGDAQSGAAISGSDGERRPAPDFSYTDLEGKGHEIWGRFASRWRGREREFNKAILFYGKPFGFGGLGGGRFVLVGDPWGAWCHEISHCFGNPHGARGSIEHG